MTDMIADQDVVLAVPEGIAQEVAVLDGEVEAEVGVAAGSQHHALEVALILVLTNVAMIAKSLSLLHLLPRSQMILETTMKSHEVHIIETNWHCAGLMQKRLLMDRTEYVSYCAGF